MKKLLLTSFLITAPLLAVVNIAPVDVGAKPGLSGHIAGTATTKRGNTEKDEYSGDLKIQYDEGTDYVAWGVLSYNYGEASGVSNEDKAYAHLRFIHKLYGDDWCGELFAQTQNDKFRSIQARTLGGAGIRWRFFNTEAWGRGYAGLGAFYEYVDYSDSQINPTENTARLNSYAAYTKGFGEASRLSYIGYYQPRLNETGDYIVSQTLELKLKIYLQLSLSFKFDYDYDAAPPAGVKKEDIVQTTSLVWDF